MIVPSAGIITAMNAAKAARYARTGDPADVLQIDEVHCPSPASGEVRVRMICAPINPADINMLEGRYGETRPLPDTPGNEGLGVVVAVGESVDQKLVGQRVLVGSQAWRSEGNWPAADVVAVPEGIGDVRASMLRVNPPTAWCLLHQFAELKPGTWIAQNAATSAVGRAVVQIAHHLGVRTLNLVRRAEAAAELRALGADAVITDGPEAAVEAASFLGTTKTSLGLNAVGGPSATRLAGLLADGGSLVTYGAMSKEALKIPNGFLIFRDLVFRGFWLTRWLRTAGESERSKVYGEIFRLAEAGAFAPKVAAEFVLDQVKDAVTLAASGRAGGKVILRPNA